MIKFGVNNLTEYELLAIILGVGSSEENVFNLSKRILNNYENLKQLLEVTYEELIKIKGIKQAKATKIIASIEFAKRIFEYNPVKQKLDNPKTIYSLMRFDLEGKMHEEFFVLFLDNRLKLIKKKMIAKGNENILGFDVKNILKDALKIGSSNLVLIHNHPSGNPYPSTADIESTKAIIKACEAVDISVVDHLIIGTNNYYSFLENHKI